MKTLKNSIVKGLREYIGYEVVPTDTADRKPNYPYLSYKLITPLENRGGYSLINEAVPSSSAEFEYDIKITRKEQATFTMSVNTYSLDENEACDLAIKAADWFKFLGYEYLKDCNIVVIKVSNISDRTTQIVDDYEKRYGFDVRCRVAREIVKTVETIEQYNFNHIK